MMNTQTLLNRPQILQSTLKLTSLIVKNNREELTQKTLLLRKREKVSKQRIKTFQALNQTAKESDGGLTTGGLLAGGALSRLGIRKPANNIRPFRKPIKPGKLSGLSRLGGLRRISKGSVITNTLFAGLDFANRKSAGQTNLQAGLGAGGGAVGGIAGAAIGQALIPVPVLGALIGGFVGSTIGSGLADRASGVTGGDFRRRQLEQESIRQLGRTEFTDGLDRFDSALDKLRKYDDDNRAFILRATGNDPKNKFRFAPRPTGGGATQADIDAAYARGVSMGVGGLILGTVGTVLVVKGGAFIASGAAAVKLKALGAFIIKKIGLKNALPRLLAFLKKQELLFRMSKFDPSKAPGISRKGKLIREGNKLLKEIRNEPSTKRPNITKENLNKFFEAIRNVDKKPRIRFKPQFNKIFKNKKLRDLIKQKREDAEILKKGEEFADSVDLLEQIRKVPFDEFADDVLKKTERLKILDFIKKIDKNITNQGKNLSDNTIIKEGDTFVANSMGGTVIGGGTSEDPYEGTLNTIKAYGYLTA